MREFEGYHQHAAALRDVPTGHRAVFVVAGGGAAVMHISMDRGQVTHSTLN
jgi:hypothetical protein